MSDPVRPDAGAAPGEGVRRPAAAVETGTQRQGLRDAGIVLPLTGAALLMPPLAQGLAIEGTLLGVPWIVLYVFGVWAGLILGAFRLARRLGRELPAEEGPRASHEAPPAR